MSDDLFLVIINALFYCVWAAYYVTYKGFSIVTFPMVLWAASALSSIYYFTSDLRTHTLHDELSIIPYLYLFVLVWIAFAPLIRFDYKSIETIHVNSVLFKYISIVIIMLSLIAIIPNIKYFLTHMLDPVAYLEAYQDKSYGTLKVLTGIPNTAMNLLKHLKGLIPIFFIVSMTTFVNSNIWMRSGLGLALINLMISYLNTSSRYALVTDLFLILFVYFLLRPFVIGNIKKRINIIGIVVLIVLIGGVILITTSRYGDRGGQDFVLYNLSYYFGESFSNFNGDLWNVSSFTEGNNCFHYFLNRFSGDGSPDRDIDLLESITHRRMFVFYTFVGDFFTDFGAFITAVIVISLAWIFLMITKVSSEISFGKILFLCLYVKVLLVGYTYWTYLNYSMEIIFTIVIGLAFNIEHNISQYNLSLSEEEDKIT